MVWQIYGSVSVLGRGGHGGYDSSSVDGGQWGRRCDGSDDVHVS